MLMLTVHLSQVAETLIKKVLAPPSQKTKLIEAKEV
jgi:photosystem II oxygen-evolving enhancer protein 2